MRRSWARCFDKNQSLMSWSRKAPTSVSLAELFRVGSSSPDIDGGRQRLLNSKFLHHELRVRTSQRAVELGSLPFGLSDRKHVVRVRNYYERIFDRLDSLPPPTTLADDKEFTSNLETIVLSGHADVIQSMALGVSEFRKDLGDDFTEDVRLAVDLHLNRFFIARIGLRFLIEHHIASRKTMEGYSGIISSACSPVEVIERSVQAASHTCRHHLGDAPNVKIVGDRDMAFTYVPYHLHYIVFELLKNSMRATVDFHGGKEEKLPDIQVILAQGEQDVTIKVGDEGGGMQLGEAKKCWTYLHTTAPPPPELEEDELSGSLDGTSFSSQVNASQGGLGSGSTVGALAGYGFGLPLSRLYSRYFGGDLNIISMEGYGTDAYVHLNLLGTDCENLPRRVLNSPSSSGSSVWGE
mmetsp:Transcript_79766/g.159275  ORF Transcript_79766/g.159275 Transcript_79766/m.159275 type:complete len:409 (-) Transcript_79766:223-1449(-)